MNKTQIKTLIEVKKKITDAYDIVDDTQLQDMYDELDETFEAMSEKAQEGDRGVRLTEDKDNVEELMDKVTEVKDALSEALDMVNSLIEG